MFITVKSNSMYFSYEIEPMSALVFEQYKSMFSGFKIDNDANLWARVLYIFLTII
jgi:hypothetical protein